MSTVSAPRSPLNQYSIELIKERQDIIGALRSETESGERLVVEGFTHDSDGTFSCEQGVSFHENEGVLTIGYHVIDASFVPAAGQFETYAYGQQTDAGANKAHVRLFGDRILYNHLNLGNPHGNDAAAPAISFFFTAEATGLTFSHIQKTLFKNTAAMTYEEDTSDVQHSIARQVVETVAQYAPVKGLVLAENLLT